MKKYNFDENFIFCGEAEALIILGDVIYNDKESCLVQPPTIEDSNTAAKWNGSSWDIVDMELFGDFWVGFLVLRLICLSIKIHSNYLLWRQAW
jgi:hypothetical protein